MLKKLKKMRKTTSLVAFLFIFSLIATSCGGNKKKVPPPPPPGNGGAFNKTELPPVKQSPSLLDQYSTDSKTGESRKDAAARKACEKEGGEWEKENKKCSLKNDKESEQVKALVSQQIGCLESGGKWDAEVKKCDKVVNEKGWTTGAKVAVGVAAGALVLGGIGMWALGKNSGKKEGSAEDLLTKYNATPKDLQNIESLKKQLENKETCEKLTEEYSKICKNGCPVSNSAVAARQELLVAVVSTCGGATPAALTQYLRGGDLSELQETNKKLTTQILWDLDNKIQALEKKNLETAE